MEVESEGIERRPSGNKSAEDQVSGPEFRNRTGRPPERRHGSEAELRYLIDRVSTGIMVLDTSGAVLFTNPAVESLLNRTREELQGLDMGLPTNGEQTSEVEICRPDGEPGIAELTVETVQWGGQPAYLVSFYDVTRRKRAEEKIKHLAHHDALTGLPNRRNVVETLSLALARAKRNAERIAILFVDLDGFKKINDTLGHSAGDAVLQEVASRLRSGVRSHDVVGRLSGDEFTIVLEGIQDRGAACRIVETLHNRLREPIEIDNELVRVSVSIGMSCFPDDGTDAKTLLGRADDAMYLAKGGAGAR